ncbi:MAG TPA: gluconate 2-dehydrogenase subunit 3 family protein [Acidobacteriota bacterium]|nr:gluconate 2-dehydrogenase subunit 3 family protein [Acidobacteriota bacterium]
MTRRQWFQLIFGGWCFSHGQGGAGTGHFRFSATERRTLAALVETMLPADGASPGANGQAMVSLIELRIATDQTWLPVYRYGLKVLNAASLQESTHTFAVLSPDQRAIFLETLWQTTRDHRLLQFLDLVKQDAITELFTTRRGLQWLGYRLNEVSGA